MNIPESDDIPQNAGAGGVAVGRLNTLCVIRRVDFGVYLDGGKSGVILMPGKFVPEGCRPGDMVEVFVYPDSEDRLVATTETPLAMEGEIARLKVVSMTGVGAFLDWGLPKDLLVPFIEQRQRMKEGQYYIVYIALDEKTGRLIASTKISKFLKGRPVPYASGDEVDLMVADAFDLGYNVVIDKRFMGVVYKNEVFRELEPGLTVRGYIKKVREDGKIDVALQRPGGRSRDDLAKRILARLKAAGGSLSLTDKSPPEVIYSEFQVSKKAFKVAAGSLYKQRLVAIDKDGIRLK